MVSEFEKKVYNGTLKNYTNWKQGFAEDCLEWYEIRADYQSNNLRLIEITILVFLQFHCKVNKIQ